MTDAAAYYGWHSADINGPFAASDFSFIPGAVAVHLHSYSATTLHDSKKGWSGPLVEHGASASLGNVYEPYLPFTTDLGVFATALLSGRNLAESYYSAQPVLSWMSVCVGDPLYRPYASFHVPESRVEGNPWREYRKIILAHDGETLAAATDLKARAEVKREGLYLEALGATQLDSGDAVHAEESFREAAVFTKDPAISFRLLLEQARSIEKQGRWAIAEGLLQDGLLRFVGADQQNLLHSWIKRMESSAASSPPKKTNP